MYSNFIIKGIKKLISDYLFRTIKEMVPRDGIEPSTRGFSGDVPITCFYTLIII
ncbi:conserved hypothetical protein [Mucispirillum schaedleri ASF457]|nr:conserved hypothetical protein [Mucispirillum schaedleri ASF457]